MLIQISMEKYRMYQLITIRGIRFNVVLYVDDRLATYRRGEWQRVHGADSTGKG